jgi:hypothetical protein
VFGDALVQRRREDFHFVKICEKKQAEEVRASRHSEILFLDGAGDEYHRIVLNDAKALEVEMAGVLEKYRPREVSWASTDGRLPADPKKPVVLVFADSSKESGEALKLLRDRSVAFFHDRFIFVKTAYRKDSEEAKKWGVAQAPAFVLLEAGRAEPVERVTLPKAAWELRGLLARALARAAERK